MGKAGKVFGPFLPCKEAPLSSVPPPPRPPPPLVYPEDTPWEAWDALRLHLGLIVQQAGFDLNLPVTATAAAVSAFHAVFPRYFTKDELETKPTRVSRCMAACLFFAGKSSESSLKLREAVNCVDFLNWKLKKVFMQGEKNSKEEDADEKRSGEKSNDRDRETARRSRSEEGGEEEEEEREEEEEDKESGGSSRKAERGVKDEEEPKRSGEGKEDEGQKDVAGRGDAERGAEESKNKKKGRPFSRGGKTAVPPAFLDGYTPMGIREYWKLRHECLLEEQRLCQALGFYLELPLLQDVVLEAQLLLLFSHKEAHLYWAIINDIAATPLMTQFTLPVLLAAGAICTRKLMREFAQEDKEEEEERVGKSHGQQMTKRAEETNQGEGGGGQEACPEEREEGAFFLGSVLRTRIGAIDRTEREEENEGCLLGDGEDGDESACRNDSMVWHEDTEEVLQRLRPLLEGSPEFWTLFDAKNTSATSFSPDVKKGYMTDAPGTARNHSSAFSSHERGGGIEGNEEKRRRREKLQLYVHLGEVCSRLMAFYGLVVKFQKHSKTDLLL